MYFGTQNIKLNKLIGTGSFGNVYEGEDIRSGKKIAIKIESLALPFP